MTRRVLCCLALLCLVLTGCGNPRVAPTDRPAAGDAASPSTRQSVMPEKGADQRVAAALSRHADVTVAIAGDSTSAGPLNWPRVWLAMTAESDPGVRLEVSEWDVDTEVYLDAVEVGAGESGGGSITVLNGSAPGQRLDYQRERLEQMYPRERHLDVLVVNEGHNYEGATAEGFQRALDEFLAAYAELHPESAVLISSQNPQYGTKNRWREDHASRQASLADYAAAREYAYLPVYESWQGLTEDEGRSRVAGDGVHPTQGGEGATQPDTKGTVYWAGIMRNVIHAAG